jgi:hypothetical protein
MTTTAERAVVPPSEKPMGRIPCLDWTCTREHEWLPVGPTRADYHLVDEDASKS